MQTEARRHRGVNKALTTAMRSAAAIPAVQRGYTLVELLVGVAIGTVVMASLGGTLMVLEVRVAAKIQSNLDTKDAANRAIDLIRREATLSAYLEPGGTDSNESLLANCISSTPIRLAQSNSASIICYKAVTPSDLPAVYQAVYKGPCVLVRLGPPFRPNGDLDTSATPIAHVLLDGIARSGSLCQFRVTFGRSTLATSNFPFIYRNADIRITMASPSSSYYGFSVRSPTTPAYDGNSMYSLCASTTNLGCAEDSRQVTYHYKPFMNSTNEIIDDTKTSSSKENLFYFQYPFSDYILSQDSGTGPCTYRQCYVQRNGKGVKLSNVDGLIFGDREIRPGS